MSAESALLDRLVALAADLPETSTSTSYGRPALKVAGKAFAAVRAGDTLVLHLPIEQKQLLLTTAPEIFYETDHYRGWPSVLARASAISDDELKLRLRQAWLAKAPRKLARLLE